jgi:zinc transporter ZupT
MVLWLPVLLSVAAGFADIIGGSIPVLRKLNSAQMLMMTAVGAGFLLGATVLDRLPDAMAQLPKWAPLYIVIGYLVLLLLDKYGHAHGPGVSLNPNEIDGNSLHNPRASVDGAVARPSGMAMLIAMVIHTFMDGVVIAGSFGSGEAAGVLMFMAITLHKIPEGLSMATISLASGGTRRQAFSWSSLLGLSTVLGAALTLWLGQLDGTLVRVIMALATGSFLFISTTGLIPTIKDSDDKRGVSMVVLGVVLFLVSLTAVKMTGLK